MATDDPHRAPRSTRAPVQHGAATPVLQPLLPLPDPYSPLLPLPLLPSPGGSPGRGTGAVFPALESPLAHTQHSPRQCPSAGASPLFGTPPALGLVLGLRSVLVRFVN